MRLMSFALTTAQVRAKQKTVTRRLGWRHARPGMIVQPVVKGMGLKKGQSPEKIGGPIRFVRVSREMLGDITQTDCAREGFPEFTPGQFVTMFRQHNECRRATPVTRIEFEYL